MSSAATVALPAPADANRRRAFLLVFTCTVIGALAQMFIKGGASHLARPGFLGAILGLLTSPLLFTGYALYGVNTVLLAIALRESELSLVYPVIALTYVWVAILSVFFLHESMNSFKVAGIATIVIGVAVLGKGKF